MPFKMVEGLFEKVIFYWMLVLDWCLGNCLTKDLFCTFTHEVPTAGMLWVVRHTSELAVSQSPPVFPIHHSWGVRVSYSCCICLNLNIFQMHRLDLLVLPLKITACNHFDFPVGIFHRRLLSLWELFHWISLLEVHWQYHCILSVHFRLTMTMKK